MPRTPIARRWTRAAVAATVLAAGASPARAQPVALGTLRVPFYTATPWTLTAWREDAGTTGGGIPQYSYWFTGTAPSFIDVWQFGFGGYHGDYFFQTAITNSSIGVVRLFNFGEHDIDLWTATVPFSYESEHVVSPSPLVGDASIVGFVGWNACFTDPLGGPGFCASDVGGVTSAVTFAPEPSTVALLFGGLLALGGAARRRR